MKRIQNETYFDVSELANYLGLTETTIRSYIHNGKIKGQKIGKSWYARESAVKAFFAPTIEPLIIESQITQTSEKRNSLKMMMELILSAPETNKITSETFSEIIKHIHAIAELIKTPQIEEMSPVLSNQDNLTLQK